MFYDEIVALVYKFLGLSGLSVLYGLSGVLGYWFFKKILNNNSLSLILFLFIYLLSLSVFNLGFRAQFLTFIFLEFELFVLLRKPKWIYSFPILFAIWANTHGAFVLGLAVLGIYLVSKIRKGNPPAADKFGELRRLGIVTLLSIIAPLLNPYGIGVYQESLLHANYPLDKLIAEWVAPSAWTQVIVIGISGTVGVLMIKEWRKNIFLLILLSLFTYLSLTARRNIPLWGLILAISFAQVYQAKWFKFANNLQLEILQKVAIVIGILVLFATQVSHTVEIDTNWNSYCTGIGYRLDLPCKAVEYINTHPILGRNVYTAYEWGGFLEWQLPQYKYFTDGRMVTWSTQEGRSPYTIYLELIQAQTGWNERLRAYGTDWMLIGTGTFLDIELSKNPQGWKEVYRDQTAVIYQVVQNQKQF